MFNQGKMLLLPHPHLSRCRIAPSRARVETAHHATPQPAPRHRNRASLPPPPPPAQVHMPRHRNRASLHMPRHRNRASLHMTPLPLQTAAAAHASCSIASSARHALSSMAPASTRTTRSAARTRADFLAAQNCRAITSSGRGPATATCPRPRALGVTPRAVPAQRPAQRSPERPTPKRFCWRGLTSCESAALASAASSARARASRSAAARCAAALASASASTAHCALGRAAPARGSPRRAAAGARPACACDVSSQYRGKGRDVSSQYGGRDETCPFSTGKWGGGGLCLGRLLRRGRAGLGGAANVARAREALAGLHEGALGGRELDGERPAQALRRAHHHEEPVRQIALPRLLQQLAPESVEAAAPPPRRPRLSPRACSRCVTRRVRLVRGEGRDVST